MGSRVGPWTLTSSSSEPGSPGSSPPPSSPTPAAGSSSSTRRARPTSAARRSGRSAGCSSSTAPSSAGWASRTRVDLALAGLAGHAPASTGAEDHWRAQWARAYVDFAAGEKRSWLHEQGMRFFPVVGWAERGDGSRRRARQLGAAVPHHLGHRPGCRGTLRAPGRGHVVAAGRVELRAPPPGRRAGRRPAARSPACAGPVLAPTTRAARPADEPRRRRRLRADRARPSSSPPAASARNHDLVRANWPARLGTPPEHMLTGVPAHVDGRMLAITEAAGGRLVNRDRMWHYVEGIENWDPIWPRHAHPHPARAELAVVRRQRRPAARAAVPGLRHPRHAAAPAPDRARPQLVHPTQKIIGKEFALSGSEQNPDLTGKSVNGRARPGARRTCPAPVRAFLDQRRRLRRRPTRSASWSARMNALTPDAPLDAGAHRAPGRRARPPDRQRLQQGRPGHRDPRRAKLPRRQADPHRHARTGSSTPRPARSSPCGSQHPHPQDPRRPRDRPLGRASCPRRASRCPACMPRARSPGSAAVGCTATARSRAPSSAAASSPAAPPAAPQPPPRDSCGLPQSSPHSERSGCSPFALLRRDR